MFLKFLIDQANEKAFPQVTVIDPKPDPNISTFRPLDQAINSNIKYNGNGYMPCNGYVPCQVHDPQLYICELILDIQPVHLRPDLRAERIEGAMPCHNYKGKGEKPEGCWQIGKM